MQTDTSGFYRGFTEMLVTGTVAVSPAGDFMSGDVQDSLVRPRALVKLVRISCP